MKKLLSYVCCVVSVLILVGCGTQQTLTPPSQPSSSSTPQLIKVGVIAPISGPAANLGTDMVNVFSFGVKEFNNTQSAYKIQLIIEDGKCNGKDAAAAAQKLVNVDQVKVILGGLCSSETLAASKITEPAGVVLLSSVSSSPEISKSPNYTYRYYNDLNQAATVNEYLQKSGVKKIAILYENTDYGIGFANALTDAFGADNVIIQEKFNSNEKDFSLLTKQLARQKDQIERIVFVPNSDSVAISIILALEAEGLTDAFRNKIIGPETIASSSVLSELKIAMEGIKSSQLPDVATFGTQATDFITTFKAQYPIMFADTFLILYKEAFDLITRGITNSDYGPDNINEYIKSISETNPTTGLFGSYYFNGADVVGVSFIMKEVKDGKLVPLMDRNF